MRVYVVSFFLGALLISPPNLYATQQDIVEQAESINEVQPSEAGVYIEKVNDQYNDMKAFWFEGVAKAIVALLNFWQVTADLKFAAEMENAKEFTAGILASTTMDQNAKIAAIKYFIGESVEINRYKHFDQELDGVVNEILKDLESLKKNNIAALELTSPDAVRQEYHRIGKIVAERISLAVAGNVVASDADIDRLAKNVPGLGPTKIKELKQKLAELQSAKIQLDAVVDRFQSTIPTAQQLTTDRRLVRTLVPIMADWGSGVLDALQLASATVKISSGNYNVADLYDVPAAITGLVSLLKACSGKCAISNGAFALLSSTKQWTQYSVMFASLVDDDTHWADAIQRYNNEKLNPLQMQSFYQDMANEFYHQWMISLMQASHAVDARNYALVMARLNAMKTARDLAKDLKERDTKGYLNNFGVAAFLGFSIDAEVANKFNEILNPQPTINDLIVLFTSKYLAEIHKDGSAAMQRAQQRIVSAIEDVLRGNSAFHLYVLNKSTVRDQIDSELARFKKGEFFYHCFDAASLYDGRYGEQVPDEGYFIYAMNVRDDVVYKLRSVPSEFWGNNGCYSFVLPEDGEYRFQSIAVNVSVGQTVREYIYYNLSVRHLNLHDYSFSSDGPEVGGSGALNDTGIQYCLRQNSIDAVCSDSEIAGQDGTYGRDAANRNNVLQKKGGGTGGFDFTKIANDGSELPASANLGTGAKDWACTRDNVTGLVWEIKAESLEFRGKEHTFSWYDPNPITNLGDPGFPDGGSCAAVSCDTHSYKLAVRAVKLCGRSDWRMPTVTELMNIVDNSKTRATKIDQVYFPDADLDYDMYWSGDTKRWQTYNKVGVNFDSGNTFSGIGENIGRVRLVSGGGQ